MVSRVGRRPSPLTALQVKRLTEPGYYADGAGLYLQVAKGGSKSWLFKFKLAGKAREMGLGSANTFSLSEARERAREQRQRLADGIDPIAAKRESTLQRRMADASIITFDKAAARYIEAHAPGWRNDKHRQQWENTLATYATPIIGDLPVSRVDTAQVLRVLQPIWTSKAETASRLRGRIESVLDWAKVQGYREGENPARWKGQLRCKAVEALASELEAKTKGRVPGELKAFFDRLQALTQKRNAGRRPKPPRRSPLRQAIIEAMGPLRAEEMTFHAAMLSLAHSPVGALRVRKEGNCWHCENENEDWPPELLTREQLQELFKAAR